MTKKILSVILACLLMVSTFAFTASAADELVYYVEQGAEGNGTEDDPFGTLEEAITALDFQDGTVYIYGTYDISTFSHDEWLGMVVVKGATEDSVITLAANQGPVFKGDITFKDIKFELGQYCHFNTGAGKLVMDAGSKFDSIVHLAPMGNNTVESTELVVKSGSIKSVLLGAYVYDITKGVEKDVNITVDGGSIQTLYLGTDSYSASMTGITVGGNINIVVNSGNIGQIVRYGRSEPEVFGALNIIFNNKMEAPAKLTYPDTIFSGVYIIKSKLGGVVMPTEEPGVFKLEAKKGFIAEIAGKQYPNGTVTLQPGTTEVNWVRGEQAEEKTEIKLVIGKAEIVTNGVAKTLDVPAQIINGRTMVPLRAIFEALGASVEWNGDTRTVTSEKDGTKISLAIDDTNLYVNGVAKTLDVPAQIINDRTMVPARAIAEAYGCDVQWDETTRTVTIIK